MMQTETLTENKQKYWVRFKTDSGKLLQVSTSPIAKNRTGNTVYETTDEVAGSISRNKVSMRFCSVQRDKINDEWTIVENSDTLALRVGETKLFRISSQLSQAEVNLVLYPEQSILDININIHVLQQNFRLKKINNILNADSELFNLYFCKNGDPDYLLGMCKIDPAELVATRSIRIDLGFLTRYADWSQISIFTRKVFNSYNLEISNADITVADKFQTKKPLQQSFLQGSADIGLSFTKNSVCVTNNLDDSQIYLLDGTGHINFLVCSESIDCPVGNFSVSCNKLIVDKKLNLITDFVIPENPVIVYRNKLLTVSHTLGEKNV